MVLRPESIQERLKELDRVLQELWKYQHVSLDQFQADLSLEWIIERGIVAAASLVLDIAGHILSGAYDYYAGTYEDSLEALHTEGVISTDLYTAIKGLGGFRNILVHLYLQIEPAEVYENYHKALVVLPQFAQEIGAWLDRQRKA